MKKLKPQKKKSKKKLISAVFLFAFLILIYFFIFSDFFKIEQILISETEFILSEEARQVVESALNQPRYLSFLQNNILWAPTNKISQIILSKFPEVREARVQKKYPHQISIKIRESESAAIYCQVAFLGEKETMERCFYIDNQGILFKEAPLISGGPFLVISDKSRRDLEIRSQPMTLEMLQFILSVKEKIKEQADLVLTQFALSSTIAPDIEATTPTGWKIYFDSSKNLEKQIQVFTRVLESGNLPNEYMDLRIENRVYYK